jgi:hypothetical protein
VNAVISFRRWLVASTIVIASIACSPVGRPVLPPADAGADGEASEKDDERSQTQAQGVSSSTQAETSSGPSESAGFGGSSSAWPPASSGSMSGAGANAGDRGASDASGGGDSSKSGSSSDSAAGGKTCASNQLSCDGSCVPNDERNCGTCGHDCTALRNVSGPVTCSPQGTCELGASACAAGWGNCSGDPEKGCDTDLQTHCV